MESKTKDNHGLLMFFYAETPLHAGAGGGLGAIDLPLQRERMSGLPIIQGSGLKGAWRETLRNDDPEDKESFEALFGPPPKGSGDESSSEKDEPDDRIRKQAETWSGAASFRDARLLLLSLRTVYGGWAWAVCPMTLQRLARDCLILGFENPSWANLVPESDDHALVNTKSEVAPEKFLYVEDLAYNAEKSEDLDRFARFLEDTLPSDDSYEWFKKRLKKQLVVLSDGEFRFLAGAAMEVNIRVRIDPKTGTAVKGQLWSEENFPAESLLWTLVSVTDARNGSRGEKIHAWKLARWFDKKVKDVKRIRLGGDQTVGRGMVGVRTLMVGENKND